MEQKEPGEIEELKDIKENKNKFRTLELKNK